MSSAWGGAYHCDGLGAFMLFVELSQSDLLGHAGCSSGVRPTRTRSAGGRRIARSAAGEASAQHRRIRECLSWVRWRLTEGYGSLSPFKCKLRQWHEDLRLRPKNVLLGSVASAPFMLSAFYAMTSSAYARSSREQSASGKRACLNTTIPGVLATWVQHPEMVHVLGTVADLHKARSSVPHGKRIVTDGERD